ncbi:MAG: helix-turn-helix domain-containing protein [Rhodovarius sp.]|nr:helix-turn-helix domain-containing protein [Rhodovarius sp.]MDW8316202.1 helix-turn-helix domain-containing protein [Rhodovarius sp.]
MDMDIHSFCALVKETPRQIRYMIAEGFMPPPTGGRAHARYGPEHVEAVRRYRWLRQRYSPAQIKVMMTAAGGALRLPVAPGIDLLVDPSLIGPALDPSRIAERVRELLAELPPPTSPATAKTEDTADAAA